MKELTKAAHILTMVTDDPLSMREISDKLEAHRLHCIATRVDLPPAIGDKSLSAMLGQLGLAGKLDSQESGRVRYYYLPPANKELYKAMHRLDPGSPATNAWLASARPVTDLPAALGWIL